MAGNRQSLAINAIFLALSVLVGGFYLKVVWTLRPDDGLSLATSRLPYWDFSNLWAGGRLILDGRMDWIFDVDLYRGFLRSTFSPALPDQEWSYPPTLFFLAVPFGALPILPAYLLWTVGTVLCLYLAVRPLGLRPLASVMMVLAPAVWINAVFGQNGALTAALLIGGLFNLRDRPVLGGFLIGLLAIKPHLAILAPFCVLASRNYRAFFAAAATAAGLVLATGLVFGFGAWAGFWKVTMPLMSSIMQAPYPQSYHANATTAFVFGRWLGLGLPASHAVQAAFTLTAILASIAMWRPSCAVAHETRVVLTALLAIVATPYGYSYDMVPLSVAVVFLLFRARRIGGLLLLPFWLAPLAVHIVNYLGWPLVVFLPLTLAALGLFDALRPAAAQQARP